MMPQSLVWIKNCKKYKVENEYNSRFESGLKHSTSTQASNRRAFIEKIWYFDSDLSLILNLSRNSFWVYKSGLSLLVSFELCAGYNPTLTRDLRPWAWHYSHHLRRCVMRWRELPWCSKRGGAQKGCNLPQLNVYKISGKSLPVGWEVETPPVRSPERIFRKNWELWWIEFRLFKQT